MTSLRLRPELEDVLRTVPGIQAVSVVTTPDGAPIEVHVLADQGKPAKQVVRDVQSIAMTAFDLDLDRKIVSVVQVGEAPSATPLQLVPEPPEPTVRPVVQRVSVSTEPGSSAAAVTVRIGDDEFSGEVTGAPTTAARSRMVAEATVQAVGELLGAGCEVESAQLLRAGAHDVAVVVVALQVPRVGEQLLTGSALVRTYPDDAVVRAVLDALNRHLAG
ncbi:hypothetical protein [Angustibacter luteus]|uniref:Roadblock/LAMTOR2 domain-containing protein n=1 Tax=Angustibacter luteus TaxID=658456 RepID=A0ABW1JGH2_9ACTN